MLFRVADKRITALGYLWMTSSHVWDRKTYYTLKTKVKGYRKIKPSQLRRKNPFTLIHLPKAFRWMNLNTYYGLRSASTSCIGCFFEGRVGKYSPKTRENWSNGIRPMDLTFIGSQDDLKSLIIDFRNHKANKSGLYSAKLECVCSCDLGICPMHLFAKFVKMRENAY